jgi:uncharacterized protein involved in exopolysaccharide biosynthesis
MRHFSMTSNEDKELDFRELSRTFWSDRWMLAALTAAFSLIGLTYALLATEWYRAETIVMPAEKRSLPPSLGQLGGLASLAGITLSNAGSQEPLAVLKSHGFARDFVDDLNLTKLFFVDEWDAKARRWKASDPRKQPDVRDAMVYFEKYIEVVTEDRKTGLVTVAIEWKDPNVAAEWANLIVKRLNARMRERSLAESGRNVDYLQQEISKTSVVSLQQAIGRLLETEMQKLMIARGDDEFALKVVDRAYPPKRPVRPKRLLIAVVSSMCGLTAGCLIVLFRRSIRQRRA